MKLRSYSVLLTTFAIRTHALSIPALSGFLPALRASHTQTPLRETLDDWIEREERVAFDKLLANVRPGGRNVEGKGKGVADGTVVASPSTNSPDYWYQCKYPHVRL
jgi:glucoamylase